MSLKAQKKSKKLKQKLKHEHPMKKPAENLSYDIESDEDDLNLFKSKLIKKKNSHNFKNEPMDIESDAESGNDSFDTESDSSSHEPIHSSEKIVKNKNKASKMKKESDSSRNCGIVNNAHDLHDEGLDGSGSSNDSDADNAMTGASTSSDISEQQADREFASIRKELSDMSFEDLQKLQQKLGQKVFNQIYHGKESSNIKSKGSSRNKIFTRENKNRPREQTSKKPVSVIRDSVSTKNKTHRDPRFDDLSGDYKDSFFKKAYSFVDDIKDREKQEIQKKLKMEKLKEKRDQLKQLIGRMEQQKAATKHKENQKDREKKIKQREKELVTQGKNPYFLKQSDKKTLELADKYRELKKSGKLENYLAKKRKKNASKKKKHLPF